MASFALEHLTFTYPGQTRPALSDLTLTIPEGAVTVLCGGFFAAAFLPGWAGWGFFLAFSIPAGLGTAFLYPSIQSCAQKWYAGRKGLATGVIGGAVGLSGAFLTLFVRAALRGFGPVQGIRGAFWALGALTLPVCLAGSAVLSDPSQKKQQPSGKNTLDLSPGQMLRTKQMSNSGGRSGSPLFSCRPAGFS